MSTGTSLINPAVHDAQAMRQAGADLLSLALMDARSRTLGWLAAFEDLSFRVPFDDFDPPLWWVGHAAWYQEYWIARHVQRGRGAAADPAGLRLASTEPCADAWFDPQSLTRAERWQDALPGAEALRRYLGSTLEATLELLDKLGPGPVDDAALHVFRMALLHEDAVGETLAVLAQALDLGPDRLNGPQQAGWLPELPARTRRDAIGMPGQRMQLGSARGGYVPDNECWAHELSVPEFEIDAQPVGWAAYAEFIDDGGYDQRRWWGHEGWEWLEATTRRAPRYVEQVTGGVLARRQGRMQRVPGAQPVLHVSAHEAEAWCRWAGRRLPTEPEWELAAARATQRGFVWGEVLEWTAGSARAWPGAPAALQVLPGQRVLRGATLLASPRLRHARARRFVPAAADELFCGFRSCAL
ncbi:SUMF1/EgtB/PvdO family nonheme iron enzyme [Aquabacterium sp. OR-4]|uniref:SUMF1/EgtB/PvdO family nonheme iron enzyme n=1 Tax=Aquabacterium sp. OR-4 TaxID=2978127 RepID=UPI0021B36AC3|nr:SUMF1/EgtB/PvdO family nonheme iron enzyme [Aquabacterium sp. OR-4]MDT7835760.1 SUMF1/EgtB/PvdO family nonheme iron enzyme [Aquabacterium sp. OR-4]